MVGGQVDADQGRAQHRDVDLRLAALGDWTGRRRHGGMISIGA